MSEHNCKQLLPMLLAKFPSLELPNPQERKSKIPVQQPKMPLNTVPILPVLPLQTTQPQTLRTSLPNPPRNNLQPPHKTKHKPLTNLNKIKTRKPPPKTTIINNFIHRINFIWNNRTSIKTIINKFEIYGRLIFDAIVD